MVRPLATPCVGEGDKGDEGDAYKQDKQNKQDGGGREGVEACGSGESGDSGESGQSQAARRKSQASTPSTPSTPSELLEALEKLETAEAWESSGSSGMAGDSGAIAASRSSRSFWRGGGSRSPVRRRWLTVWRGTTHEWFASSPPLTLWADLAREAARQAGVVFWVGRACRPYSPALRAWPAGLSGEAEYEHEHEAERETEDAQEKVSDHEGERGAAGGKREARDECDEWDERDEAMQIDLACRSVWVDLPRRSSRRVLALELMLRSPATRAVLADGRGLDRVASRRLQLAAKTGSALAMLWRADEEVDRISSAPFRWRVRPEPGEAGRPRWRVEPCRCRDARARREGWSQEAFVVEMRGAKGLVPVSASMVDRSGASASSA